MSDVVSFLTVPTLFKAIYFQPHTVKFKHIPARFYGALTMAEEQNISAYSQDQQKWVRRIYAERPFAHDSRLNRWGHAIYNNKLIQYGPHGPFLHTIFTSQIAPVLPPGKCLIGDFGSGNGSVSDTVACQLQRPEDSPARPVGVDIFNETLWSREKFELLIPIIQGDLRQIPVKDNTFHAGLMRFALPFVPKADQAGVLQEIHRVLKPGAVLVVLNHGGFNETAEDLAWNSLFAETARFEKLTHMHYPSCERLVQMATKDARFNVQHTQDLTDIALSYFSPQVAGQGIDGKLPQPTKRRMRQELKALFEACKQEGVLPFEPRSLRPKSLRVPWRMYTCVLKKE